MGRGCNDGLRPLLMTLSAEGSAQERSPLAAPAPVPHEFALRKAHIDKVAGQIASKAYPRRRFPGCRPISIGAITRWRRRHSGCRKRRGRIGCPSNCRASVRRAGDSRRAAGGARAGIHTPPR